MSLVEKVNALAQAIGEDIRSLTAAQASLEANLDALPQSDWNQKSDTALDYIKNKPDVVNNVVAGSNGAISVSRNGAAAATVTVYTHPSDGANTVTTAAVEKITVNAAGHVTSAAAANLGDLPDTTTYVKMTAEERTKLSGIEAQANKYIHPSDGSAAANTAAELKKVKINDAGHVVATAAVTLDDVADGTTYTKMTAAEHTKLAGIEAQANKYVHPAAGPTTALTTAKIQKITVDTNGHVNTVTNATQDDLPDSSSYVRMTPAERTKLSGIATGANNYTLPVATSSVLGGVKQGTGVTIAADGTISTTVYSTATGTTKGIVQLSDAVNSSYGVSDGYAATPAAVKAAYDLATEAKNLGAVAYKYKGTVTDVSALSAITTKAVGDVYNVETVGTNYAWNGTAWDALGGMVAIDSSPANGSTNPITSDAVYDLKTAIEAAIALKADSSAIGDTSADFVSTYNSAKSGS